MAFSIKNWLDDGSTPHDAAAMKDIEKRLSDYTDSIGGGVELGYAQITSNFTQTGAGNSEITGLSVTVTVGSRPILVRFYAAQVACSSGSGLAGLGLYEGATALQSTFGPQGTGNSHVCSEARVTPSPGSHTYKANLIQVVTGNTTITATNTQPTFLQVIQL